MADCILSSQNRFYVKEETTFGQVGAVDSSNRLSAVRLAIEQRREVPQRRDKTGSRTFTGVAPGARRTTNFSLETYLVANPVPAVPPAVGPLVSASLGGGARVFGGSTAGTGSTTSQIVFSSAHNLIQGQAFGFNGEIRFAQVVVDGATVTTNAPFSTAPQTGATLTAAVSYFPANDLPSASIFDYWDPESAVQRIVTAASVNRFQVQINADFHALRFEGPAQDIVDSVSFLQGQGGLSGFPAEPEVADATPPPIPGNLGQAWLGTAATKFLTISSATVSLQNDLALRNREFGSTVAHCVAPGERRVTADIELFEADDAATRELYASAREEVPIQAMFQLGQATGQMLGLYLPNLTPSVPDFDDSDRVLRWRFTDSRAHGSINDEYIVAFG